MSKTYVSREIEKVIASSEYPKNMALACAWVIAHFKGINIKILDVSEFSSLCDFNIIASAENTTQAKAIVAEIQAQLKEQGANINSVEGLSDGEWLLLDMGDYIVHIFQETNRDIFSLESLWPQAVQVEIPNEFYYGTSEAEQKESSENYF